jgi:hypothetical protein
MKKMIICAVLLSAALISNAQKVKRVKPKYRNPETYTVPGMLQNQPQAVYPFTYYHKKRRRGNFRMQGLMENYNQSEKQRSSVEKKKRQSTKYLIGKIGG